jgi:hypothetical protein
MTAIGRNTVLKNRVVKTTKNTSIATRKKLIDDVTNVLLKRAKVTKADVLESALPIWVSQNLDLLTASEKRKYKSVIL